MESVANSSGTDVVLVKMRIIFFCLLIACCGCSHLLYQPTKDQILDPSKAGLSPENIWLKDSSGKNIHGWHFKNRSAEKTKAFIVFFHGNGQNLSSHFASLMWIVDYGYDFVIFDYQGYGKSDGEPTPENTVEDGEMYIRWAYEKAQKMKVPLIVYAESLGGAVALKSVLDTKTEIPYKAMIVNSSFLSYQKTGQKVLSRVWLTWPFQWLPYIFLSDQFAPGKKIKELSPIPLLVIHGTKDQVIDFELGEKLFETASEPKEFWKIEGGTHIDAFWRERNLYRRKFLLYLDKILGNH